METVSKEVIQDNTIMTAEEIKIKKEKIIQEVYDIVGQKTGMKVDPQSNFLEIGGNSIVAAMIVGEINNKFFIDIQISQLLTEDKIEVFLDQIVREVLNKKDDSGDRMGIPDKNEGDGKKWPLTSDQERIWFLDKITPDNPAFILNLGLKFIGKLQIDRLNKSFNYVLMKHDMLRVRFIVEDNKAYHSVRETLTIEIPVEDIKENEIDAILARETSHGLNIMEDNLVGIKIFRIDENCHIIYFKVHHIIADAWSVLVLTNDLLSHYLGLVSGQDIAFEKLKTNFGDFIGYQKAVIEKNQEKQINFWKETLKNVPTTINLPYDFERSKVLTYKAGHIPFELSEEMAKSLIGLTSSLKVTTFNFLYSVFTTLLYLISEQGEFLIGCGLANRKLPEFNKLVGNFANALVMKNRINPDLKVIDLMKQNQETSNQAFNNSDMPFFTIVKYVSVRTEFNINPLFQVMFNLQMRNFPPIPGVEYEFFDLFSGYSDFDIFLNMIINNQTIMGFFDYSKDLFLDSTAQSIVSCFISLLGQFIENPNITVKDIILSEDIKNIIEGHKIRKYKQKIVISSTFSDQPISDSVSFWMNMLKIPSNVILADYNQVFNQLLDPVQQMIMNKDGVNVILIRIEDWIRYSNKDSGGNPDKEKLLNICEDFIRSLQKALQNFSVPVILGILPSGKNSGFISDETIELLTGKIGEIAGLNNNIYLLKTEEILAQFPMKEIFDDVTDKEGHLPFTRNFYKAVGTSISRKIHAIKKQPYKVIVLDCDNTIWKGVIAEDGIDKIEIDPARVEFQKFISSLQNKGMQLCLVSKNEESDILKVFREKSGMVLDLDQITSIKSNWDNKSRNIELIAGELNLGLDSFIFVDDSPVECAEVGSALPEVLTVPFPQEPEKISDLIKHGWFWDNLKTTDEDRTRTLMYKQELQRKNDIEKHITFEGFYNSLKLQIDIEDLKDEDLARLSQLTQRANQFNTTTIRRSEKEIKEFISDKKNKCLAVRVSDRFGSYGLVGAILSVIEEDHFTVDSFILSCRALGKGVEHRMMNSIGEEAIKNDKKDFVIPYYSTSKNIPALNFLSGLKFLKKEESENGLNFHFDAGQMKNLKFNPSMVQKNEAADGKYEKKEIARGRIDHQALLDIINKYNDIDKIVIKTSAAEGNAQTESKPENEVQKRILTLIHELTDIENISIDENFNNLGVYSVQLVQLLSVLQEEFNRPILLTDLFEYTNIRKLADYLSKGDVSDNKMNEYKERGAQQKNIMQALKK